MPSPFSTDCGELCQHSDYRVGCLSCSAHDIRGELKEAVTEKEKREEAVRSYQALLQKKGLRSQDRERFVLKNDRATKQRIAWEERCQTLTEIAASLEAGVKDICACTDPGALSQAFEDNAIEHEEEFRQVWRNAAKTSDSDGRIQFHLEDSKCNLAFKGLDRSNIPATPDMLVSKGQGLQIFLKAGKNSRTLPNLAVGERPGPAIMSYGRAIELFGVLEEPGEDWRQKSEPSSIQDSMAQLNIATAPQPESAPASMDTSEPKTEHELGRLDQWSRRTDPLLSNDEQWALFAPKKFLADTALLTRQYQQFCVRMEAQEQEKKGKQSGEGSTTDPVVPECPKDDRDGWPPAEQLDWAGLTNWVYRCKQADKAFGMKTVRSWNIQREQRKTELCDLVKNWTPPESYDDGTSGYPDPRRYGTEEPLIDMDVRKLLGIKKPAKGAKPTVTKG